MKIDPLMSSDLHLLRWHGLSLFHLLHPWVFKLDMLVQATLRPVIFGAFLDRALKMPVDVDRLPPVPLLFVTHEAANELLIVGEEGVVGHRYHVALLGEERVPLEVV
jgi:hypothetical protein